MTTYQSLSIHEKINLKSSNKNIGFRMDRLAHSLIEIKNHPCDFSMPLNNKMQKWSFAKKSIQFKHKF